MSHLNRLITSDETQYLKFGMLASLAAILIFMGQIATYLIVDSVFETDPIWLERIATKCHVDVSVNKSILNFKSVVQSGVPIFTYGAYMGMLIEKKLFLSSSTDRKAR